MGGGKIEFANTLRGFAALAVIIAHYFGVFWVARPTVSGFINAPELPINEYAIPNYISLVNSFPIFNFGAFGVALFFVISGFVIPFSFRKVGGFAFLINRVLRIFPTYFVGFSVTLLAVYCSTLYFSGVWPYTNSEIAIHYFPGLRDLLWSRDIDGIVWTLEVELKFYLVCAAFYFPIRRGSLYIFILPVLIAAASVVLSGKLELWGSTDAGLYVKAIAFVYPAKYLVFMFIGVAFHYMNAGRLPHAAGYFIIGALFILFAALWYSGPTSNSFYLVWSYAAALLVFSFAYAFPSLFKANPVFDFFANISYPLYVIHGVAGYAALRILLDQGVKAWISLIIVTGSSFVLSWIIHKAIESPSQAVGKRLASLLARPGSSELQMPARS
ncbi:acyltransferase [Pseudomonas sp. BIGb0164]|uniref:acyltransferase family protein n=1 Tax=Pseudomonas sp. BIGb0164 TaxID=2940605 RepID=UPI002166C468|nr:acyltransferase [Pseudomonas sp. BIGb0164]MCS4246142.1 peptidoglycan/LPS O-acetylase OafA/YrhL [Pseudomonas sp. BIGb0164]